jgi:hypothetical protein
LLSVAPTSITLGCSGSARRKHITITNAGADSVNWQATTSSNYGIALSSYSGNLNPQQHVTITVSNNSFFGIGDSPNGTITIEPSGDNSGDAGNAGAATVVNYTIACNQGG